MECSDVVQSSGWEDTSVARILKSDTKETTHDVVMGPGGGARGVTTFS